jgi:hypothetical protein
MANCQVTTQAIWPIAKSLPKSDRSKAPSAIHGPLVPVFYPANRANTLHTALKTILEYITCANVTTGNMWRLKSKPCWVLLMKTSVSKEIQSLKSGKACGFDAIPNECLQHLPRILLVHLTYLFKHCLQLGHFVAAWKDAKI